MADTDIHIVTTCMGRLAHLQQSLPRMAAQPGCGVTVVDWSCPQRCGDWVERDFAPVRVVRVAGEAHYSAARSRNAGAAGVDAQWLAFVDADVLLAPGFAEAFRALREPRRWYRARPCPPPLHGTVVCMREDFERVGGYDEIIAGWGGEDRDLYTRLVLAGVADAGFPATLLAQIGHDHTLRTRYQADGDLHRNHAHNRLYIQAKHDLMRLGGRDLTREERRELYARAGDAVAQMPAGGGMVRFDVSLLGETLSPEYRLRPRLLYELTRTPLAAAPPWPPAG